ncbi:winged helix-turn-helix domain-containing protein [Candidatus Nitrotoga sp. 1052]|uniref:winged helix-turn-helix domain-containing protein n=1 Tax=Candidatus Nitrotoga sp. 1052 TaxID=2886964 RepID=UPI001F98CE1C|nr:hypothetical protein NTG1052_140085 [Candidatus Nitrotoga sp. 1052]
MEKEDASKQSREVLHERCKQVIRVHRKGVAVMEIVAQTGLSWTAVNTALRLYKAEGSGALKPCVRGKKPGSGRRLMVSQELTIQQTICDKRPEQLKMDFALWSRPTVRQHIELAHGIKLSIRAVGNYLARWGLHHKNPSKKHMSSALKLSRLGLMNSIRPLKPEQKPKVRKFTGATRRR